MDAIILRGVRTHNLKNFDLILPHNKFYVITGVSGSGKSSLAFDTLYAEGQRRYVGSLSAYARQFLERMEKPDADSVSGIPPAIAIQAKNVITNARSTVGTQTEINDYLRVLFARVGRTFCPDCSEEAISSDPRSTAEYLLGNYHSAEGFILFRVPLGKAGKPYLKDFLTELERQGFSEFFHAEKIFRGTEVLEIKNLREDLVVLVDRLSLKDSEKKRLTESLELAFRTGKGTMEVFVGGKQLQFSHGLQCPHCGKNFHRPTPNLFSFNSPLGACPACQGFGRVITVDWDLVIPDQNKTLAGGAIEPWTKPSAEWEFTVLLKHCQRRKIPANKPWRELSREHKNFVLKGDRPAGQEWRERDYFSVEDYFKTLERKTYKMHVRVFLSKYRNYIPCKDCGETRLKPEGLTVKVAGKNIFEVQIMSLTEMGQFLESLDLGPAEKEKSEPVWLEISRRVRFLNEVGLGYLSLSRLARTLSGGEVERIHLATSLGSALVDTLYVLDEPSIGLHERDNRMLIKLLHELRDLGNTVAVVEHDRTMIEAADEVIDMGPLGGERGGEIIFQGKIEDLKRSQRSLTGQYLCGKLKIERSRSTSSSPHTNNSSFPHAFRRESPPEADPPRSLAEKYSDPRHIFGEEWLRIRGAAEHNLKNINVELPLHRLVVITGVSGSGKSTLLYDILHHHYLRFRGRPVQDLGKVKSISGFEACDEIMLMDQSPIGRTPRSNPATYLKVYDEVRKLFSRTEQARRQGFEPGHFSFNVDGGRCPVCKGDGQVKVEMHFLADIFIPCEACKTKRFKPEILEVRFQGKNIDDILHLSIDEAVTFFNAHRVVTEKLSILQKIGLGYLRLGQSATTLSGGEAQRLKLAYEMTQKSAQHILYLLDEPTTGLHYHDIHYLMEAFDELLSRGHSLVVIEHNMEIIRSADYVVDLGPEGGSQGGELIFQGSTRDLMICPNSFTGKYLKLYQKQPATPPKTQWCQA